MNLKLWLACGALVCLLSGCTGDVDGIAGTSTEPNTMGQGESSSSELLTSSEAELSSSSAKSSSSSKPETSSSSSSGIHVPPPKGCKPSPLIKRATYGVMDAFTAKRVAALEEQGLENGAAKDSATEELFRELGLDTLFYDSTLFGNLPGFSDYMLEYTLYYLYKHPLYSEELSPELVEDFADGVLEPENFCIDSIPYASLDRLPFEYLPLGCVYNEDEISLPLAILRNIWRKCAAMPYCDKSVGDTVITIGNDHFVCENGSWVTLEMQGKELNGTLCTENGAKVSSNGVHVCYEGYWHPVYRAAFVPAEYLFNPDYDYGTFTDSRDGRVYRTTVFNGKTWLAQDMDYYDGSDTLFVNQSLCVKLLENGRADAVGSEYCDGASRFYTVNVSKKVCPDGWRLPSKEDLSSMAEMGSEEWRALYGKITVGGTDEYGLSLRLDNKISPYGDVLEGKINYFWLEEGFYARNSVFSADISGFIDNPDKNGEFVPVRCIKE